FGARVAEHASQAVVAIHETTLGGGDKYTLTDVLEDVTVAVFGRFARGNVPHDVEYAGASRGLGSGSKEVAAKIGVELLAGTGTLAEGTISPVFASAG